MNDINLNMKSVIIFVIAILTFVVIDKIYTQRARDKAFKHGTPLIVKVVDKVVNKGITSRGPGSKKRTNRYIIITHSNGEEERMPVTKKDFSMFKKGDEIPAVILDGKVYLNKADSSNSHKE